MVLDFPILADYAVLPVGEKLIYATHGHVHNLKNLPPLAAGDILLHGHTHIPAWTEFGDGNLYLNPGSLSIPKEGSAHIDEVFDRMAHPLILKLYLNQKQESVQLKQYMEAMSRRTEKLSVIVAEEGADGDSVPANERPFVRILGEDGSDTGLGFHGVPGGHEFTSFVIGLYNAAGPGQEVDAQIMERIHAIKKPLHIKILVTLACSMCPDLVIAAQKIAAENPQVTAEIYDVMLYPSYQKRYKVMSVPCLVVNDEHVVFGRKTLPELLDYLDEIL